MLHMSVCAVLYMSGVRSVAYEWSVVLPEVLSVELAVSEQFLTVLEPPAHSTLEAFHLIYSRY